MQCSAGHRRRGASGRAIIQLLVEFVFVEFVFVEFVLVGFVLVEFVLGCDGNMWRRHSFGGRGV